MNVCKRERRGMARVIEAAYLLLTLGAALAPGWADKPTDFHKGKSKYLCFYICFFVVDKFRVSRPETRQVRQVRQTAAVMSRRPAVIMCCDVPLVCLVTQRLAGSVVHLLVVFFQAVGNLS